MGTCSNEKFFEERRKRFQYRKLEVLKYVKDSLDRRLSAVSASIAKLEEQIERDKVENTVNLE